MNFTAFTQDSACCGFLFAKHMDMDMGTLHIPQRLHCMVYECARQISWLSLSSSGLEIPTPVDNQLSFFGIAAVCTMASEKTS